VTESFAILAPAISPSERFNLAAVIVAFAIFALVTAVFAIAAVSTESSASSEAPIAFAPI